MTKRTAVLFLMLAWAAQAAPPQGTPDAPWYDRELVHNAAHDLEETLEKFAPRLTKTETETLRQAFLAYQKSIDHLHTEMSDLDKELDAKIILTAFEKTIAPYQRFLSAGRGNQLHAKERMRFASEALDLVYLQGQVAFWMTKSVP